MKGLGKTHNIGEDNFGQYSFFLNDTFFHSFFSDGLLCKCFYCIQVAQKPCVLHEIDFSELPLSELFQKLELGQVEHFHVFFVRRKTFLWVSFWPLFLIYLSQCIVNRFKWEKSIISGFILNDWIGQKISVYISFLAKQRTFRFSVDGSLEWNY